MEEQEFLTPLLYLWKKITGLEFKQGPEIREYPLSRQRTNFMKFQLYQSEGKN